MKIIWLVILLSLWFFLILFDYDFNNLFWNGLILLASAYSFDGFLSNDQYYIKTGLWEHDKSNEDPYKTYCLLHPWSTLYSKVLAYVFIIMHIIAIGVFVSGFF